MVGQWFNESRWMTGPRRPNNFAPKEDEPMSISIREYRQEDLPAMIEIWNEVVNDGIAFPQTDPLDADRADVFFAGQNFTAVAEQKSEVVGLYILHPNNIGRCGHIGNTSYVVKSTVRGMHIGEKLVKHSLEKAKELGFRLMQFNAVVESNHSAIHLYEKLGFIRLGTIPGGFRLLDGTYANIVLFYRVL
jgi:L-amino acid N-acyltransferase YncA